jgi:uncharacterized protein (DUF885 family)
MKKRALLVCGVIAAGLVVGAVSGPFAMGQAADKAWIAKSNAYTQQLLDVQLKHAPERGSRQGLVQFDKLISNPTLADQLEARKELEAVLAKLKAAQTTEKDKNVVQDLEILEKTFNLQFREQDYQLAHNVPFINASSAVFGGLRGLLDDQVAAERRPDAVVRLRKYAGVEPGYKPFTEILKQRALEQIAKPGMVYPSKTEVETELGRNNNYIDGMAALFTKYKLTGWEEPYAKLKTELADYDAWVRTTILPKARTDFREPPAEYALDLEGYGIDIPPAQIAAMAHKAFAEYQAEMVTIAAQIAKQKGYSSSDYRDVIRELKKAQIVGDATLPFYQKRLGEIEKIIAAQNLVTLPDRPAIIRLASAAETAQQPAPHMQPPPFLHNTGQRGEFVLPMNIPSATGGAEEKYDDFTFDAVAWTLTSHEARPGHELQFDSMVEHGVSLARALFAFNSTNVEGWGLYSEYIMKPYMPLEGQLMSLDHRLMRATRAFVDPELQSGKLTPEQVYKILENDVVLSHALATEEVERYTFRAPGQANSYFYGYTKLLALRKDTEAALGKKFDQKKFHDFILAQGLLPPDLMRKAVMEEFIPSQK